MYAQFFSNQIIFFLLKKSDETNAEWLLCNQREDRGTETADGRTKEREAGGREIPQRGGQMSTAYPGTK